MSISVSSSGALLVTWRKTQLTESSLDSSTLLVLFVCSFPISPRDTTERQAIDILNVDSLSQLHGGGVGCGLWGVGCGVSGRGRWACSMPGDLDRRSGYQVNEGVVYRCGWHIVSHTRCCVDEVECKPNDPLSLVSSYSQSPDKTGHLLSPSHLVLTRWVKHLACSLSPLPFTDRRQSNDVRRCK